jgi:hypothetical protein
MKIILFSYVGFFFPELLCRTSRCIEGTLTNYLSYFIYFVFRLVDPYEIILLWLLLLLLSLKSFSFPSLDKVHAWLLINKKITNSKI